MTTVFRHGTLTVQMKWVLLNKGSILMCADEQRKRAIIKFFKDTYNPDVSEVVKIKEDLEK